MDNPHQNNRLLASLGEGLTPLLGDLTIVRIEQAETVCKADELITHAYFPHEGMISQLTVLEDGSEVEACVIGNRGGVGLSAAMEPKRSFTQDICQVAGECSRIEIGRLRLAYEESPELRRLVFRNMTFQMGFMSQSVACNARHLIDRRLCRWLLTCCDAVGTETVPMTQEFISYLLGVRRTTVSIAAGDLQRRGLIRTNRGKVNILDRQAVEEISCECYGITKTYADDYLPAAA